MKKFTTFARRIRMDGRMIASEDWSEHGEEV